MFTLAERRRAAAAALAGAARWSGVGRGRRRPPSSTCSLTLAASARAARAARWTYSTDLFERAHGRADARPPARGCWSRSPRTRTCGSRALALLGEAERAPGAGGVEPHGGGRTRADACIHELFEAQAARTPGRGGGASSRASALTYARAERAGQPAGAPPARAWAWGRRRGWAICLERGPGDGGRRSWPCSRRAAPTCRWTPRYPAERLRYMLEDSAPGRAAGARARWPPAAALRRARASRCSRSTRRRGRLGGAAGGRTRPRRGSRPEHLGVRDLHLGLHRPPQGRDEPAPAAWSTGWPGGGALGAGRGRRGALPDLARLRRLRPASSSFRSPWARGW